MNRLLKEWQNRLFLNDWKIVLKENCRPDEMQMQNVQGESEWEEVNKCAVIRILDERFYGNRILPFDKEQVLVHELLHIKLSFIQNTDNKFHDRLVHQYIEDLAKSLVNAKRYN